MLAASDRTAGRAAELLGRLHGDGELLAVLTLRMWRSRGRGGIFSLLWPVVTPVFLLGVYYCAFGVILGLRRLPGEADYALSMFCGMTVFNVFAESLQTGAVSLISRPGYVKNMTGDPEVLPLAAVGCAMLTGLCWFAVVLAAAGYAGTLGSRLLRLPLILPPWCAFCAGVALFAGAISVFLRDFPQFAVLLQQGLFFLTPIVFPLSAVPEPLRFLILANPLTGFVEAFRAAVFGLPAAGTGTLWLCGFAVLLLGWGFFHRIRREVVDAV